jgi:hypothetical protein
MRSHTKEELTREALATRALSNPDFNGFIHDKAIYTANCDCTHRRRVDHRKLFDYTWLALETDEFAHRGYDAVDEKRDRYNDLFMADSHKWIFIRFNPDGKEGDMEEKLAKLIETVEHHIERIKRGENTELMEIHYLFY